MQKHTKQNFLAISIVLLLIATFVFILSACNTTIQSVDFKVTFDVDGESYYVIATQGTEVLKMPNDPTKEGFVFDGWFWDKDIWQRPFTANSLLNEPLKADMRVYAKWTDENELEKFTVTFETNGGTTLQPMICALIKTQPVTNKDYNTFLGWYTDANFNESAKVTFPLEVTEDITLYARWSINFTDGIQFSLQTSSNSYFVSGYTGVETTLVIPETYNGVPVTGIVARAFEGNSMLTEVYIPDSVATVGLGAFSECYTLKKVKMSGNLQLLGSSAFSNCINLEEIDLPATLQNIGGEAFFGCAKLKELYLANELVNIGTNIIRGCNSLEKLTMPGRITLISLVGDTVDNIPQSLKDIRIADGSTNITDGAFANCTMIKSVWICKSVETIAQNAFDGATNIEEIVFEEDSELQSFELGVFEDCSKLRHMNVPFVGSSINLHKNSHIGYLFGSTDYTKNLSLTPETLTDIKITKLIGDYALYNCTNVLNVEIGDSITYIGECAFYNCYRLGNIILPSNLKSIDIQAFYNCQGFTQISIPSSVTHIYDSAFEKCDNLEGVYVTDIVCWCNITFEDMYSNPLYKNKTLYLNGEKISGDFEIPSGATNIPSYTFYSTDLNSLVIPEGVTSIESYATSRLTKIVLPSSIKRIDPSAFYADSIYIVDLAKWCEIDFFCMDSSEELENWMIENRIHISELSPTGGDDLYLNSELITDLIIPDSVHHISDSAFYGNKNLKSVTIPNSVETVGAMAFRDCNNLVNVELADSIRDIGWGAFYDCNHLTNISIPNNVTSIKEELFCGCNDLTSITIPDSVTSLAQRALSWCNNLTNITIPDSVTSIGSEAFYGCYRLVEVYNKSSLNIVAGNIDNGYVGYYAKNVFTSPNGSKLTTTADGFVVYDNTTLVNYLETETAITIPNSVTGVGDYAFFGCSGLTSITIPDSVTSIGSYAFCGCSGLTSITIPDSVASIGDGAFYKCSELTSITMPNSVTSIGNDAFYYCIGLTSITIPNSVTSIGNDAFHGCSELTSITIPNSVTSIGNDAFFYCSGLTSITIPDSVTSIGNYAFFYCSGLTNVYYNGTAADWEKIDIDFNNSYLISATRYYYSEEQPTDNGNYWHYVNGVVTVWTKEN